MRIEIDNLGRDENVFAYSSPVCPSSRTRNKPTDTRALVDPFPSLGTETPSRHR